MDYYEGEARSNLPITGDKRSVASMPSIRAAKYQEGEIAAPELVMTNLRFHDFL